MELFSEKQRFAQWYVLLPFMALWVVIGSGLVTQLGFGQPWGDNPMTDSGLLVFAASMLLFTAFFFSIRLETTIRTDGITLRFFPFHVQPKIFTWEQIRSATVITYRPLLDYGGWGLRYSFRFRAWAYSVSGSEAIKVELQDRYIMIGTRKPAEAADALKIAGGKQDER